MALNEEDRGLSAQLSRFLGTGALSAILQLCCSPVLRAEPSYSVRRPAHTWPT